MLIRNSLQCLLRRHRPSKAFISSNRTSDTYRAFYTAFAKAFYSSETSTPYFYHPGFADDWKERFSESFLLYDDFVSEEEEQKLVKEVEPHLKRLVYEKDHWDEVG